MVSRLLRIPRAVNTPLAMLAAVILGLAFPGSAAQAQCGGVNGTPCKVWERVPSCNSGLVEDFGKGKCVKPAAPAPAAKPACGGVDQRPCTVLERIPSCDKALYEDFGRGKCLLVGDYLRDAHGKCVHVPGVSTANNVQLRTWDCVAMAHLTWEKVPLVLDFKGDARPGQQPFWLKNRLTGKCAAVHAGQTHDGALVIQWDCGSGKHFQWAFDGTNQLMHGESGKCLHSASGVQNAALTIGECARLQPPKEMVWTYGQLLEGFKVGDLTPENMPGALQNGLGRCLHVPNESHANGLQLTMWDCGQHLNQVLWVREKGVTVDQRYFFFKSRMTRKCFAVHAGQKQDGAAVVQWECGGEPQGHNFHWTWEMGGQLVNRESGKCLHAGSDRNAPATIVECSVLAVPANNLWQFMKPGGETYR